MRDFNLSEREPKNLPPEKLLDILRVIYPEDIAVELFEMLTAGSEENK